MSVDGVDFQIEEPWPYKRDVSGQWYSQKFNGPGLRYMICISLKKGDICFVDGPHPCGQKNDLQIFEQSVLPLLEDYERVEADSGYSKHDPEFVKSPEGNYVRSRESARLSNRARARQEGINKKVKQWYCMKGKYRHNLLDHSKLFYAVIVLTQLAIDEGERLFPITYFNS